ncbi:MAG: hypothetical protein J7L86_01670 [Candidatus Marinimicrobia bacterium]|nr:hypothetical protein [Candidatus Neomarinimicrobiota bacterium]
MIAMMNSTADQILPPATRQLTKQQHVLVVVLILSFAIDFKGFPGGSPIQFLLLGLNTVAFLLLAVSYRMTLPRKSLGAFVFWGWMAFLVTGTIGALVNATPFERYLRIIYPFALFLEGFLVAWWTTKNSHNAATIVSTMMVTAVVSLFFIFWWGFHFTGNSVGQIRYQILSPLLPFVVVVAGYDLFFSHQRKSWSFILITVSVGLVGLSVTRAPILIVGFVVVLILLAALVNALSSGTFPRPIMRAVFWCLLGGIIGIIVVNLFYPDVLGRWIHRALGEARNVTLWTRVAAIIGQFQALTSNHFGWLTGQGFGSSYPWPFSEFDWIIPYLGKDPSSSVWFPGEFMWMTFLYYGGYIIGSVAVSVLLAGTICAFRLITKCLKTQSWQNPLSRPLWVGMLGFFTFIGKGFTSNPFIIRNAALFMGLCLGLVLTQKSSTMLSKIRIRP